MGPQVWARMSVDLFAYAHLSDYPSRSRHVCETSGFWLLLIRLVGFGKRAPAKAMRSSSAAIAPAKVLTIAQACCSAAPFGGPNNKLAPNLRGQCPV